MKHSVHFIHINIDSLLPKIDELQHLAKTADASVVCITETKFDNSISSSEAEIEDYDLLRLDLSRRGGAVACYVKNKLAYNCKQNFCEISKVFFLIFFYQN